MPVSYAPGRVIPLSEPIVHRGKVATDDGVWTHIPDDRHGRHQARAGRWSTNAAVVLRKTVGPTVTSDAAGCLADLMARVDEMLATAPEVAAIGVGTASMVDFSAGRVVESTNLPLQRRAAARPAPGAFRAAGGHRQRRHRRLPGRTPLRCRRGRRRDADAHAGHRHRRRHHLWRATLPRLQRCRRASSATWSSTCTGHGAAARAPPRAVWRASARGSAIGAAAVAQARAKPDSALGRALAAGEAVDGPLLTRLALAGDGDAVASVRAHRHAAGRRHRQPGEHLQPGARRGGRRLWRRPGDLLLEPARRQVARQALRPQRDEVRIVPARLGEDAGLVGAAALCLGELFS